MKFKQIHHIFQTPLYLLLDTIFNATFNLNLPNMNDNEDGNAQPESEIVVIFLHINFRDSELYTSPEPFEFDGHQYQVALGLYFERKVDGIAKKAVDKYRGDQTYADYPSLFIDQDCTLLSCDANIPGHKLVIDTNKSLKENFELNKQNSQQVNRTQSVTEMATSATQFLNNMHNVQKKLEQHASEEDKKAKAKALTNDILGYGPYAFVGLFFGATTMLILITYLGKQRVFDDGMQLQAEAGAPLAILLSMFFVVAIAVAANKCCNSEKFKDFGLDDGVASTLIFRIATAVGLCSTAAVAVQLTVAMEHDIAQYVTFGTIGGALVLALLTTALEALYYHYDKVANQPKPEKYVVLS